MRSSSGPQCKAKILLAVVVCLSVVVSKSIAQSSPPQQTASSAGTTPVYDVATIKPNNSGSGSLNIDSNDETFMATNISIKALLENASGIREDLISGLPGWAESAHYDIVAKVVDADADTMRHLTREQRENMLQQLLADRFQLKTHIEVKELPVFDLVIAKGGIKFHEFDHSNPNAEQDSMSVNNTEMTANGVLMNSLAKMLAGQVQRNVIDKTGLTGKYDLHLKWRRQENGTDAGLGDDALPTLFTALQEQLGIKLQSSKGPVDTLVVDHIAAPSEN
jgi:uncharacterized protein (TIGR03435 family)